MTSVLEPVVAVEGHDRPLQTALGRELGAGRTPSLVALRRLSEFPVLGVEVLGWDVVSQWRLGRAIRRDSYRQVGVVLTTALGKPVTLVGHAGYVLNVVGTSTTPVVKPLYRVLNHAAWGWPEDWPTGDDRPTGWALRVTPLAPRPKKSA